ncbi:MAG TPA: ABC transporter ATP-binding protein [Oscillospiraceae bacterium]|nr:ABC transporter ATP-binding protein [Oscillospiraceae bacterium]
MTKLLKYGKPYIVLLISAIVMLFIQALSDLNLPNYMSDIVNIGLQRSGIQDTAPRAIGEEMYTKLAQFGVNLSDSYTLVKAGEGDYSKEFPDAEKENIYVLNEDISSDDMDELGLEFGKITQMTMLMSQGKDPKTAAEIVEKTDETMLRQMAVQFTKKEYTDLGVDTDKIQQEYIIKTGLIMLLITLIGAAATITVAFLSSKIAAGMARDIRRGIFSKVEGFSSNEFDKFSTSSLITRTTNDITQIQMLIIMGIRMMFYSPIVAVGGVIMAVRKGPSISWIIALACIVLIGLIAFVFIKAMPKFKIMQKLIDRLNLVFRENLTGIMAVRAFGNQDFERKRFDKANNDLTDNMLYVSRIMIFMFPAIMLLMNGVSLLIVWVGADKISQSAMQVGDMMAFMQYAMQIIMSFLMMSIMFIMVPRAAVSAERISEVLETKQSIFDPEKPEQFDNSKTGYVEFKNVNFRYNGAEEDVLKNITFTANPGETTAFIGSTGAGKSTLINLIPRFYDATEGEICVNGVNVRNVLQSDLHEQIGYAPQKGILHSGTVSTNIRYGKEAASDEEIKAAAETAQAMDFISSNEEGFDKEISQGGANVSGGQKQRLSIARALIRKSPIYLFDDCFSALDFQTESKLRKALKGYTNNATVLVVAQRVSTIMNAEQIIVLNNGEIVGKGTHKELLSSCPTYYEIASSQLSKEEL